jgi:hypothetical protein
MWIIFGLLFVIGFLAIIANLINGAVEILKVIAPPFLIICAIFFVLACIFG